MRGFAPASPVDIAEHRAPGRKLGFRAVPPGRTRDRDWPGTRVQVRQRGAPSGPRRNSFLLGDFPLNCADLRASVNLARGTAFDMEQILSGPSKTPLLDQVRTPEDLRRIEAGALRQLADELRQETIDAVAVTGGHLGAGLGVVELTIALHYVFDTPRDRLIWDVGHQSYPHKIITGRRDRIRTLRQGGGLSGFTKRSAFRRWRSFQRLASN